MKMTELTDTMVRLELAEEALAIRMDFLREWTVWHLQHTCIFNELLVRHTRKVMVVAEKLIKLYALTEVEADQVRAAVLLHDGVKLQGHENHAGRMADILTDAQDFRAHLEQIPVVVAIRHHAAWWGTPAIDWRKCSHVVQVMDIADYLATRRNIEVYL